LNSVVVRPILAEEVQRRAELMQSHHYLGYRGIAGRALRYVASIEGQWVALNGWGREYAPQPAPGSWRASGIW